MSLYKSDFTLWLLSVVMAVFLPGCRNTAKTLPEPDYTLPAKAPKVTRPSIRTVNNLLLSLKNVVEISGNGYIVDSNEDDRQCYLINFKGDTLYSASEVIRSANDAVERIHVTRSEFFIALDDDGWYFLFPEGNDSIKSIKLKEKPVTKNLQCESDPFYASVLTHDGNIIFGDGDVPWNLSRLRVVPQIIYDRKGNPLSNWASSISEVGVGRYFFTYSESDSVASPKIFADAHGKQIGTDTYDDFRCSEFDKIASVQKDGLWGCINMSGKRLIPFEYDLPLIFNDGIAITQKNGQWCAVTENGDFTSLSDYDSVSSFSEGMAVISKDNAYGYMNTNLEPVIEPFFERAENFKDGVAFVSKNGHNLFITKDNKVWFELFSADRYVDVDPNFKTNWNYQVVSDGDSYYLVNTQDKNGIQLIYNCKNGIYKQNNDTILISRFLNNSPNSNRTCARIIKRDRKEVKVEIQNGYLTDIIFLPGIDSLLCQVGKYYFYADYNGNTGYKNSAEIDKIILEKETAHIDKDALFNEVKTELEFLLKRKRIKGVVILDSSFKIYDSHSGSIEISWNRSSTGFDINYFLETGKIIETTAVQDYTYEIPFSINSGGGFMSFSDGRISSMSTR